MQQAVKSHFLHDRFGRTSGRLLHTMKFLHKACETFFLSLIRAYQLFLSPLLPPSCRFTPTCSQYAIEAIKHYGISRGLFMSLWRIMRCHPFNEGGYDPVDKSC